MKIMVVDEHKKLLREPYVVRLGGWTLKRYLEEAPEHMLCEFVRGEVVMYSPATAEHQDLVRFLLRLLDGYCEAKGWGKLLMGPAAIRILPDVVREPDIFVLPPEEASKAKGVPLSVRPALVVEVMSPATRTIDLMEKAEDYALAGIPEYWAVDPGHKELLIHRLEEGRYRTEPAKGGKARSLSLPGFWMDVGWLFRDPLPSAAECLKAVLSGEHES